MPLTKAQKALYEAALRRKGLQPGKAVRQDPRTFVGPIETHKRLMPVDGWEYNREFGGPMTRYEDRMVPSKTYWVGKGRFQDLEDELNFAMDKGIWERKNPTGLTYYRYYNDGDLPRFKEPDSFYGSDYDSGVHYKYEYPYFDWKYPRGSGTRRAGYKKNLTRLGELELEARADEMIENDYKDYLKKMYQRFPNRAAVREAFPEEYNAMPYLEELFPE